MYKILTTLLLILLISTTSIAGDIRLGIFSGYAMEDFERGDEGFEQEDYAGTIPLGIQTEATVLPLGIAFIATGIEATFLLSPYTWELSTPGYFESTMNFNQNMVGFYVKAYALPGTFQPYAKLGLGYYFGDFEYEMKETVTNNSMIEKIEVDGGIGMNMGIGLRLGKVFLEIDYHLVERNLSTEDEIGIDDYFDTSTMTFKIGYQFYL